MTKFNIDIDTLLQSELSFDRYFVLYCIHKQDKELIILYIRKCGKIDTAVFRSLAADEYLQIAENENDSDIITFEQLSLSRKGSLLFETHGQVSVSTDDLFEVFKNNYPSKIKDKLGRVIRRPHGNRKRCLKLYNELIEEGIPHEILCKCARIYSKEKKDTRSEEFTHLLETWLHQRIFEEYVDEEDVDIEKGGFIDDV